MLHFFVQTEVFFPFRSAGEGFEAGSSVLPMAVLLVHRGAACSVLHARLHHFPSSLGFPYFQWKTFFVFIPDPQNVFADFEFEINFHYKILGKNNQIFDLCIVNF